jgi:hypothetical protein
MSTPRRSFRSTRGTVLIVSLILAAIIGISLVSYVSLANNSLKQASRSFYSNSAMNIAEIGLERAIACFNQLDNGTSAAAWTGWATNNTTYNATTSPTTPWARNTITVPNIGPGAEATIKVWVHHYEGSNTYSPKIIAKSTITQTNAAPIEKYIEVTIRKRSLFANGLVAKDDVDWSGGPMAASWNSDPTGTGSPIYAYNPSAATGTPGAMTANVTVGSLRGDIGLSGGTVWGFAKTGPTGSISGGSVHGLGTTSDDTTRRTNDFNATFPTIQTPTPTIVNTVTTTLGGSISFPRVGDLSTTATLNNVTGTYYFYNFTSLSAGIDVGGSDDMVINGNVVFIINNHPNTTTVKTGGSASLTLAAGATLNVYTDGNVAIAGNGLVNSNAQPKNCFFWGTRTTDGQTMDISGNGQLKAVVYAPNAVVDLNGGGSNGKMMGSVVAKEINMNGGTEFYYDESLANLTTGNPWGISKWKELQSAAERAAYSSQLGF